MIRFLLTHPLWDVTVVNVKGTLKYSFLLTHPLWDVTQTRKTVAFCIPISTHTSLVGCDLIWHKSSYCSSVFLLTHPLWDVTIDFIQIIYRRTFLLTHPLWDVTAIYSILQSQHPHISRDGLTIHLELY